MCAFGAWFIACAGGGRTIQIKKKSFNNAREPIVIAPRPLCTYAALPFFSTRTKTHVQGVCICDTRILLPPYFSNVLNAIFVYLTVSQRSFVQRGISLFFERPLPRMTRKTRTTLTIDAIKTYKVHFKTPCLHYLSSPLPQLFTFSQKIIQIF